MVARWYSLEAKTSPHNGSQKKLWLWKKIPWRLQFGHLDHGRNATYLGDASLSLTWEEAAGLHAELGRALAERACKTVSTA